MPADAISCVSEIEVHFKLVRTRDVPIESLVHYPLDRFCGRFDAIEVGHSVNEQEIDVRLGRSYLGVADEFVVSISAQTFNQIEDVCVVFMILSSLSKPTLCSRWCRRKLSGF